MPPLLTSEVIELSDDELVPAVSSRGRTKNSKASNHNPRRSEHELIDLTQDVEQESPSGNATVKQPLDLLARIQALNPHGTSPRPVGKTEKLPARSKATSSVIPSSDRNRQLPDGSIQSSATQNQMTQPTSNAPILSSSAKASKQSSPRKRARDGQNDDDDRRRASKKRALEANTQEEDGGGANLPSASTNPKERSDLSNGHGVESASKHASKIATSFEQPSNDANTDTISATSPKRKRRRKKRFDEAARESPPPRPAKPSSGPDNDLQNSEDESSLAQLGTWEPRSEPLQPSKRPEARRGAISSEPVKKPGQGHLEATAAATPLRQVSPADDTSAGASPSKQLQAEAARNDMEALPDTAASDEVPNPEPEAETVGVKDTYIMPDLSMFPIERQVERIFGKYYQEMREDTDYSTRMWLKRSRCAIELHRPKARVAEHRKPGGPSVASSVFSRLRKAGTSEPTPAQSRIDSNVKFHVEVFDGSKKPTRCYLKVKPTHFEDSSSRANDVPGYAHYVSLKSNILAPNATTMPVWPYFGEDEPDPVEFEQHYSMDTQQRQRKLRRFLEAQKVEEYVESALDDLQISWDDVLHFLLDPSSDVGDNAAAQAALKSKDTFQKEDFPEVSESAKWTKVLSSLPESSTERLAKAAILCDSFQRMAKFPLWHVARRSASVQQALKSQDKSPSSIASRTCRVCLRFNCHQHGELKEEDSDDSEAESDEVVATDILYPQRVNFRKRIQLHRSRSASPMDVTAFANPVKDKKKPRYWDGGNYSKPGEYGPFYPCYHPGVTCAKANCSCVMEKRTCEKSCGCAPECPRKFKGCSCKPAKNKKPGDYVCSRDDRCACYQMGRECDPDLCGACGVCEVLDPVHRHGQTDIVNKCNNASIQRGVPKHTLLGDSGVHGMGLYAGQRIKQHEFIGEYKGEIITKLEADRRGAVYEKQNSTYLFSLNSRQEIDSNFYGNKIRFINHRDERSANVYPLIVLVNTVHRIGLFAQYSIKPGEELFFDYGPEFPEEQLGGVKSAPHARNAKLVEQFYDIEDDEDEAGNSRARKAPADGKGRGRPRKAELVKSKKPRGGARAGAGRKPYNKKNAAPADDGPDASAGNAGVGDDGDDDDDDDEEVNSRMLTQDRFETYYVSQDKDLEADPGEDSEDQSFKDAEGSAQMSSEEEYNSDDGENEDEVRVRRGRGRPRKEVL